MNGLWTTNVAIGVLCGLNCPGGTFTIDTDFLHFIKHNKNNLITKVTKLCQIAKSGPQIEHFKTTYIQAKFDFLQNPKLFFHFIWLHIQLKIV